ncbi:hypothetical protein GCM10023095_29040 [Pseudaeromonas paramecii]|uniref:Uncharacterized protein n=1 Tax=Pseudaeromonas paramecii TaxID=2138166 RepID=A0ABP8QHE9_9GAMM
MPIYWEPIANEQGGTEPASAPAASLRAAGGTHQDQAAPFTQRRSAQPETLEALYQRLREQAVEG